MRSRSEGGSDAGGGRVLNLSFEPSRGERGLRKLNKWERGGKGAPNFEHFVIT